MVQQIETQSKSGDACASPLSKWLGDMRQLGEFPLGKHDMVADLVSNKQRFFVNDFCWISLLLGLGRRKEIFAGFVHPTPVCRFTGARADVSCYLDALPEILAGQGILRE